MQAAGRSGVVATAVEAGGMPMRRALGSVLRGGGQGTCMRRQRGPVGQALSRHHCPVRCATPVMAAGMEGSSSLGLDGSAWWRCMHDKQRLVEMRQGRCQERLALGIMAAGCTRAEAEQGNYED
jgi:hypothetical protein